MLDIFVQNLHKIILTHMARTRNVTYWVVQKDQSCDYFRAGQTIHDFTKRNMDQVFLKTKQLD